jgi:hypothetical protein
MALVPFSLFGLDRLRVANGALATTFKQRCTVQQRRGHCELAVGGDRVCPENCPLAIWAALSPKDRKAQRKPIAEGLYKQGFTMEAIALQLGVTHKTVSNDLKEFVPEVQNQRTGRGRPKGSKKRPSKRQQQNVDRNPFSLSFFGRVLSP